MLFYVCLKDGLDLFEFDRPLRSPEVPFLGPGSMNEELKYLRDDSDASDHVPAEVNSF